MFLEICAFLVGCCICWHTIIHCIFLWFFVYLQYWLLFVIFQFLFCLFGSSLFFLVSLARSLSNLFTFLKNKLLVVLIFFSIFLISILSISFLVFIVSFLLLTLGFVVLFLICLDGRLGCLFEIFLVF